tara:strand:+ start:4364 stop:5080 length:717 start_codon:yes stop_codon:yes gene_type:complete
MEKICWILLFSLFLFSCSKDTPSSTEFKSASDYYPLKLGSWYVYDVDSISYNDFTDPVTVDSVSYQIKEELTDTFLDLEGNLSYEITRYKRMGNDSVIADNMPWGISDIWWVKNRNGNIERIEENNRYITLSNPILQGKKWNGNAYNYMSSLMWEYTYKNIADTFGQYENTITVVQKDSDTEIDSTCYIEVFAEEIGLVSRTRTFLESPSNSLPIHMIYKIEKGFQYFQTLKSYYIPE